MSREKTFTCPVCAGKMTVEEVYQAWNDAVDRLLCKEHGGQLDERVNKTEEINIDNRRHLCGGKIEKQLYDEDDSNYGYWYKCLQCGLRFDWSELEKETLKDE